MSEIPAYEQTAALTAKQETARVIVRGIQTMAPLNDLAPDTWQLYFDTTAEYGAYTDEELAPLGLTTAQVINCVTLLEQFKNMMNGDAVNAAVYRTTINSVRHLRI